MSKQLRLHADYALTVLWGVHPEELGPFHPDELPLTEDLRAAIMRWAEVYDNTLDPDHPEDAGFKTSAEAKAFDEEGLRLWKELQSQLGPDWRVTYYSSYQSKTFE